MQQLTWNNNDFDLTSVEVCFGLYARHQLRPHRRKSWDANPVDTNERGKLFYL